MSTCVPPQREISSEELAAYRADGVVMARGLIQREWIERIEKAVDGVCARRARSRPRLPSRGWTPDGGRPLHPRRRHPGGRSGVPVGAHRASVHGRGQRFFYDQLFSKKPGDQNATRWHVAAWVWGGMPSARSAGQGHLRRPLFLKYVGIPATTPRTGRFERPLETTAPALRRSAGGWLIPDAAV